MEVLFSGLQLGAFMSVFLIGPVYFVLIETSISRGVRAALSFDTGVLLADVVLIFIAYFASKDIIQYIEAHPALNYVAGVVFIIFGIFMFISRIKDSNKNAAGARFFHNLFQGFALNFFNPGVLFFWMASIVGLSTLSTKVSDVWLFFGSALVAFMILDFFKIILAKRIKRFLSDDRIAMIRKLSGIILIVAGLFFFVKRFIPQDSIPQEMKEIQGQFENESTE